MRAVEFDEQNFILSKPKSMSDEDCAPLPIFRDGKTVVSCWELSYEDMQEIKKTGRIYLGVLSGSTQPPVWLSVENPFLDQESEQT